MPKSKFLMDVLAAIGSTNAQPATPLNIEANTSCIVLDAQNKRMAMNADGELVSDPEDKEKYRPGIRLTRNSYRYSGKTLIVLEDTGRERLMPIYGPMTAEFLRREKRQDIYKVSLDGIPAEWNNNSRALTVQVDRKAGIAMRCHPLP